MKINVPIWVIIPFGWIVVSCNGNSEQEPSSLIPINYKYADYGLQLGERFDKHPKIDWTWAAESDPDSRIDTNGIDVYMSLSESFKIINGSQFLPVINVVTEKNKIVEFTCTMLFSADDISNDNIIAAFINDIPLLNNPNARNEIEISQNYCENQINTIECVSIERKENGYHRFMYRINYK